MTSGASSQPKDQQLDAEILLSKWRRSPNRAPLSFLFLMLTGLSIHGQVPDWMLWGWLSLALSYVVVIRVITNFDKKVGEEVRQSEQYSRRITFFVSNNMVIWSVIWSILVLGAFHLVNDLSKLVISIVIMHFSMLIVTYTPSVARRSLWVFNTVLSFAWLVWGDHYGYIFAIGFLGSLMMQRTASLELEGVVREQFTLRQEARELSEVLEHRNDQLSDTNKLKTRLIATASHDLRQPVHALGMLLENWDYQEDEATHARRLATVKSRVMLLEDMLKSLLDISRLDLGAYVPAVSLFSLPDLLREIAEAYEPIAKRKSLGLELRFLDAEAPEAQTPANAVYLMSDRGLLSRIISNLLSNAVRYTDKGRVSLTMQDLVDGISIKVSDTGRGVDLSGDANIFHAMALRRNPEQSEGLGIGLGVVEKGVEALGLSVSATSAPETGTTFEILVPGSLVQRTADGESLIDAPGRVERALNVAMGFQLLVIEDDAISRAAMAALTRKWGFEVAEAADADAALDLVVSGAFRPDLVVSDYALGGSKNGIEVTLEIAQKLGVPDMPILLVTGSFEAETAPTAVDHGMRVLQKPVRPSRLQEELFVLCDRLHRRKYGGSVEG